MVNGLACIDAKLVQPDHLFTSGLHIPRNTSNKFGSVVSLITVSQVLGLNTFGIALVRIDYAPWGVVPPHMHPRATEILTVIEGKIEAAL